MYDTDETTRREAEQAAEAEVAIRRGEEAAREEHDRIISLRILRGRAATRAAAYRHPE
jgi:hypothetical protein